jgi:hypothetical protein
MTGTADRTTTTVSVNAWNIVLHRDFHDAHTRIGVNFMFCPIEFNELNNWHYPSLLNSLFRRGL